MQRTSSLIFNYLLPLTGQKRKGTISFRISDSCNISKEYALESFWIGNLKKEDPVELPLIEFELIAAATNNFKLDNKLGEGGFGPVFKVTTLFLKHLTYYVVKYTKVHSGTCTTRDLITEIMYYPTSFTLYFFSFERAGGVCKVSFLII